MSVTPRASRPSGRQPRLGPINASHWADEQQASMRSSVSFSSSVPVPSTLLQWRSSSASSVTRQPSCCAARWVFSSTTVSAAPLASTRGSRGVNRPIMPMWSPGCGFSAPRESALTGGR
jgi:hypothetical protein